MAEMLGKPPNYTEKGRQLASVEIQLSGGPRPFAAEGLRTRFLQNISRAALAGSHDAVESRGDDQRGRQVPGRRELRTVERRS